jgi:hypothetical protein
MNMSMSSWNARAAAAKQKRGARHVCGLARRAGCGDGAQAAHVRCAYDEGHRRDRLRLQRQDVRHRALNRQPTTVVFLAVNFSMAGPHILYTRAHFARAPSLTAQGVTAAAVFVVLSGFEGALFAAYSATSRHSAILQPRASRARLARRTLEVFAMALLTGLGWEAQSALGGITRVLEPLHGPAAVARALAYDPLCARLALCQFCYQLFNSYISIRDRDGAVFIMHHLATATLCALAQAPFLHSFAPFFLGITELSSTLLCALAVFDRAGGGVAGMGERFPTVAMVLGVAFAAVFVGVRIVLWPWASYVFWADVFAVLEARAHPASVCVTFLATNAALSLLQLVWLREIVQAAVVLFRSERGALTKPAKSS